ncbi:hypothetical protein AJ80_05528 [Polytolypa hystricis UAMH7299]|uniref:Rhodopsin domain-containing protein n=1 Tax=Polytolypa hystricis (strain UAMH7299) TaxID=1447883 RepID=A0A2B7Y391_POLH7|nr:hypothetical protein AJ80_05528 [Polytolypa hystricis UAMH7299]
MGVARHNFAIALPPGSLLGIDDELHMDGMTGYWSLRRSPDIRTFNLGFHAWEIVQTTEEVTFRDVKQLYAITLSFNLLSIPILPLAKASIIIILLRVGKIIRPLRLAMYSVQIFNVAACVVPWAVLIFICPIEAGNGDAERTFGNLRCLGRHQQGNILLFINCANLVTDILVFPVPFFIMRELINTNLRSKLTLLMTFASSLCVTALSAVKVYVTYRDRILVFDNADWGYGLEYCITHGEGNVGIIVACIPTLRGLVSRGLKTRGANSSNRSPKFGTYPQNGYYTSIATGAGNRVSVGARPGSQGSFHPSDKQLLKSSDILLTTVVEASSAPANQTMFRSSSEQELQTLPPQDREENDPHTSTGMLIESNQYQHTFHPTPPLPPVHLKRV